MEQFNSFSDTSSVYVDAHDYEPDKIDILNKKHIFNIKISPLYPSILISSTSINKIFSLFEVNWFFTPQYFNFVANSQCEVIEMRNTWTSSLPSHKKGGSDLTQNSQRGVECVVEGKILDFGRKSSVENEGSNELLKKPKKPKMKRRMTFVTVNDTVGNKVKINKSIINKYINVFVNGYFTKDETENEEGFNGRGFKKHLSMREFVYDFKKKKKEIAPNEICVSYLRNFYVYSLYDKEEKFFKLKNDKELYTKLYDDSNDYVSKENLFNLLDDDSNLNDEEKEITNSENKTININIEKFLAYKYKELKDLPEISIPSIDFDDTKEETYIQIITNNEQKIAFAPISQFTNKVTESSSIIDSKGEKIFLIRDNWILKLNNEIEHLYQLTSIENQIFMTTKYFLKEKIFEIFKHKPNELIPCIQEINDKDGNLHKVLYKEIIRYKSIMTQKTKIEVEKKTYTDLPIYYLPDLETNVNFALYNKELKHKEILYKAKIKNLLRSIDYDDKTYNKYEIEMVLHQNNSYNEYYTFKNSKPNVQLFINKRQLLDEMNLLYENKNLQQNINVYNKNYEIVSVNIQNIFTSFRLNNKFYDFLSKHIVNNSSMKENDLFSYIFIEDIFNEKFPMKVPFIRKMLYDVNNHNINKKLNIITNDNLGNERIVNPEKIIESFLTKTDYHRNFNWKKNLNKNVLFYEVKDEYNNSYLISHYQYEIMKEKINSTENLFVFDINNKRVKICKNLMKSEKYYTRKWVKVRTIEEKDVYVFKSIINHIDFTKCTDELVDIVDFYEKEGKFSPNQIKTSLFVQIEEKNAKVVLICK